LAGPAGLGSPRALRAVTVGGGGFRARFFGARCFRGQFFWVQFFWVRFVGRGRVDGLIGGRTLVIQAFIAVEASHVSRPLSHARSVTERPRNHPGQTPERKSVV